MLLVSFSTVATLISPLTSSFPTKVSQSPRVNISVSYSKHLLIASVSGLENSYDILLMPGIVMLSPISIPWLSLIKIIIASIDSLTGDKVIIYGLSE